MNNCICHSACLGADLRIVLREPFSPSDNTSEVDDCIRLILFNSGPNSLAITDIDLSPWWRTYPRTGLAQLRNHSCANEPMSTSDENALALQLK